MGGVWQVKAGIRLDRIKYPMLLIYGSDGPWYTEWFDDDGFDSIKGIKKIETVDEADHDLTDIDKENEAIDVVLEWFKKYF